MQKKNSQRSAEEERNERRLERVFKRIFPRLETALPDTANLFNSFDPMTPRTTFSNAGRLLDGYAAPDSVNGRLMMRVIKLGIKTGGLKSLMSGQLDHVIKTAKFEAGRDPRYSLLLKLMHEVDDVRRLGSYVVVQRHADPREMFLTQIDPLAELKAARSTTGEKRFNYTREAFRRTVEHLYDPYLRTLTYLSYVRLQKEQSEFQKIESMDLGNVMGHVEAKLSDYPELFDARAVWFRNALTHEIPEYDVYSDTMILKDRKRSGSIATDELLDLTESLYQISAQTITLVSQLYLFREIFRDTGFFDLCIDYVPRIALETNPTKITEVENEFLGHCNLIFN